MNRHPQTDEEWLDSPYRENWLKGYREGRVKSMPAVLRVRFGPTGEHLLPRVEKIVGPFAVLVMNALETAPDLAAVAALLPPA